MTQTVQEALLRTTSTPAPKAWHWLLAGSMAVAAHAISALPFLPEVETIILDLPEEEFEEIGVNLAPIVQPPEVEAPPPPPEPIEEIPVIQERASNSPPPSPPAEPREIPDLPDISPQAIPELWMGSGGANGQGVDLEEYLFLREWLAGARQEVLRRLQYPEDAARRQITGSASIIIIADRYGEIVDWRYIRESNHEILNRAVARAVRSVRRLPTFPEGTRHETLAYQLDIRFELVMSDGTILAEADTAEAAAAAATAAAEHEAAMREVTGIAELVACASSASTLIPRRDEILARRDELERTRGEIEVEMNRYERERRDPPRRFTRRLDAHNEAIQQFDQDVTRFQQQAAAYSAQCDNIQTSYENFAAACQPFAGTDNAFCTAFGGFWGRLNSTE